MREILPRIESYTLAECIARGGRGEVWRAIYRGKGPPPYGEVIAVKILFPGRFDPSALKRAVKVLIKLSHPSLMRLFKYGKIKRRFYLLVEYLKGRNLKRISSEKGVYSLSQALRIFLRVGSALEYLHQHGLIYGDLKLENIILKKEDTPTLIDLDHSVIKKEVGFFLGLLGLGGKKKIIDVTPGYTPSEVMKGEYPDIPSDIYSFGMSLFVFLRGGKTLEGFGERLGYKSDFIKEEILNWMDGKGPVTFRGSEKEREILSEGLANFLYQTLRVDPNLRYQNMSYLLEDMKKIVRTSELLGARG